MTWRERLALLFGAATPFAFGDAQALPTPQQAGPRFEPTPMDRDAWTYTDPAQQQRLMRLAGHSSHSSHASHASHASHYSGSGSDASPALPSATPDYSTPSTSPASSPEPPPSLPTPPPQPYGPSAVVKLPPVDAAPSSAEPGRFSQVRVRMFVQRVQIALLALGYDPGSADGNIGLKTKEAIKSYQAKSGLPATGYLDVDTLRRLGITQ